MTPLLLVLAERRDKYVWKYCSGDILPKFDEVKITG